MIPISLILVPAIPALLFALLAVPALRGQVRPLAPLAPVPALLAATADAPPAPVTLDWLLLGTRLELTETGAVFLFFTALLWMLAGWQAVRLMLGDPRGDRFTACFLAAMTGNLGLLVAQDMASFFTFFAMMSLASWGLVLHGGGDSQRFAGKVYIAFAVAGEVALFAGLAIGAHASGSQMLSAMAGDTVPMLATLLACFGLLIKLGIVPMHLWLPLAHAAAPAPASAVLSGAMLKAGLFGLMTILPLGTAAMPELGATLAALAVAGLLIAPALGLVQGEAKAVLAYSSIGQTSLMALALAVALMAPESWVVIAPAGILLVVHHGFAKAAMFMGVPAVWATSQGIGRAVVVGGLALPALALAGFPWTGGFAAKTGLDLAFSGTAGAWSDWLAPLMILSSLGTALLMLRALALMAATPARPVPAGVTMPFVAALLLASVGLWLAPGLTLPQKTPALADLAPIATALGFAAVFTLGFRAAGLTLVPLAPGQVLSVVRRDRAAAPPALTIPPREARSLRPRRRPLARLRPELGGLTVLGTAAALAVAALLTSDWPAALPPAPPPNLEIGG